MGQAIMDMVISFNIMQVPPFIEEVIEVNWAAFIG